MKHFDPQPAVEETLICVPGVSQADSVKPNCAEVGTAADISSGAKREVYFQDSRCFNGSVNDIQNAMSRYRGEMAS